MRAISRCAGKSQNRSHIYFLMFFPTLWLFSAQGLPVFNSPQGSLVPMRMFCILQNPLARSSLVYKPESHQHLMMPPISCNYMRQLRFLKKHSLETTPGTAYLHFLLIWGAIRHSRLLRMKVWDRAFLSKKGKILLVLANFMQATPFLPKVLKEFLSALIPSFRVVFTNCSAGCILEHEQVHRLLFKPANQGRNELSRFGEMSSLPFYHLNLLNNSEKPS